jgi:hypothetical protein
MINLEDALEWAIEEVEGDTPQVNAENPEGEWPIHGRVIYGLFGQHRYFIREGAEVTFSSSHAYPSLKQGQEAIARAEAVGFRIE